MDWFTHIFFAVALGIAFRWRRPAVVASAFGAMTPDLDALLSPVTIVAPQLWFLDHRTFTHSLLTGVPWALFVAWLVQRPGVLGVWRRLFRLDISFAVDRTAVLPVAVGVVSHIFLDSLTVQGPALFAPLSAQRYQLNWFYFIDLAPLAVSSVLIVLTLWQRGSPEQRRIGLAVLLAAVVATGVWRAAAGAVVRGENPDASVAPTWNPHQYWGWRTLPNASVEVFLAEAGRPDAVFTAWFPLLQVVGQGSPPWDISRERTIAESTLDYTAFVMNTYLVALNASEDPSGMWRLGYYDPVRRAQALYSGSENVFSPEDLILRVTADGGVSAEWP